MPFRKFASYFRDINTARRRATQRRAVSFYRLPRRFILAYREGRMDVHQISADPDVRMPIYVVRAALRRAGVLRNSGTRKTLMLKDIPLQMRQDYAACQTSSIKIAAQLSTAERRVTPAQVVKALRTGGYAVGPHRPPAEVASP